MPPISGGEFAREIDVEVKDAVSDIKSLAGVPGWLTEAILACLERNFSTVGTWGRVGSGGNWGGLSVLGVATTRRVFAPIGFLIGEPVEVVAGLAGIEAGTVVGIVRVGFSGVSCLVEPVDGA